MVSRKDDKIDFDKLEKELYSAVDADSKYWRENDAKIRAVTQKVASYDEFRDIVLAAHLKPLEKTDKIGQTFKQPWNAATGSTDQRDTANSKQQNTSVEPSTKLPTTGHEFARLWKCVHKLPAQRYNFLLQLGGPRLEQIFRAEIGFGLLGEILSALCCVYKREDSSNVLAILDSLTRANRFGLSLQFLDSSERDICCELFNKLQAADAKSDENQTVSDTVSRLATLYNVH